MANTAVLALDKYPEEPSTVKVADLLNTLFTWAFVAELLIKITGLGFREYARDSFNVFDAVIVAISLVDVVVTATMGDENTSTLSAFKGVRLLRVFKLARSWSSFREILSKIIVTMKDVSTFSVLLLMFMFIFTLLGMELFGHKVKYVGDTSVAADVPGGASPRPNFDNVGMGFTSVFAIAIGDDWNLLMALAYRANGFIALVFYPLVFIFMNLILLNLFLAILLSNFETSDEPQEESKDQDEKAINKFKKRMRRRCRRCCLRCEARCPCFFFREEDAQSAASEDESDERAAFRDAEGVDGDIGVEGVGGGIIHGDEYDGSEEGALRRSITGAPRGAALQPFAAIDEVEPI